MIHFFKKIYCFSFVLKKTLVAATFNPLMDCGECVLYLTAYSGCYLSLFLKDSLPALNHHSSLCVKVELVVSAHRRLLWYTFNYEAIIGLHPSCTHSSAKLIGQVQQFNTISASYLLRSPEYRLSLKCFFACLLSISSLCVCQSFVWILPMWSGLDCKRGHLILNNLPDKTKIKTPDW